LERISVADYLAYEAASTGCNWRAPAGYGSLVAASLPRPIDLRLSTPVESIGTGLA
jgi:monoamine oxidase